ncbi:peptide deformylase [Clostridia bacterium]|nr:peptide deformylase [Clostridia bacterium]
MALRNLLGSDDERLRKASRVVEKFDGRLHTLLDDMRETLGKADGAGIAAPQIGVLRRVVVIDLEDETPLEMVNPVITEKSGTQREIEGCLSLPDLWGYVVRPNYVKIEAQDRFGNKFVKEGTDELATAFCHEIDHLNGVLFADLADEIVDDPQASESYRKRKRKRRQRKAKQEM